MSSDYQSAELVLRAIQALEKKKTVFKSQIDNWCVWPTIRFLLFMELSHLPLEQSGGESIRSRRLFRWVVSFLLAIVQIITARRGAIVVKTFSSARREVEDGKYKDIYFDELLKHALSHFKVETFNNPMFRKHGRRALFPTHMDAAVIETTTGILAKCWRPAAVQKAAKTLLESLKEDIPCSATLTEQITQSLSRFYWGRRIYSFFLKRLKPTGVWVADSGEWALSAAALEQRVPVFEFQHGLFDSNHPNALSAFCAPWKSQIPRPHRILTYGPYWSSEVRKMGFYAEELLAVGSVYLDSYRARRAEFRRTRNPSECVMVLTTSGIDRKALIHFMCEFLALAKAELRIRLRIKTHPNYEGNDNYYQQMLGSDPRVEIIHATSSPTTLELIAKSDFHLSISSSCHYDALGLGTPTVILGLTTHDVVGALKSKGHAYFATTPEELLRVVRQHNGEEVSPSIGSSYFLSEALTRTRAILGFTAHTSAKSRMDCSWE